MISTCLRYAQRKGGGSASCGVSTQEGESNNTNCFHFAGISLLMKYAQMITAEMWLKIITTNTIIIIAVITKRVS
jgi:hypothetical protein